jgi:hypothetical protein
MFIIFFATTIFTIYNKVLYNDLLDTFFANLINIGSVSSVDASERFKVITNFISSVTIITICINLPILFVIKVMNSSVYRLNYSKQFRILQFISLNCKTIIISYNTLKFIDWFNGMLSLSGVTYYDLFHGELSQMLDKFYFEDFLKMISFFASIMMFIPSFLKLTLKWLLVLGIIALLLGSLAGVVFIIVWIFSYNPTFKNYVRSSDEPDVIIIEKRRLKNPKLKKFLSIMIKLGIVLIIGSIIGLFFYLSISKASF